MKIYKSTIDSRFSEHNNIKFPQWSVQRDEHTTIKKRVISSGTILIFFLVSSSFSSLWVINNNRQMNHSCLYQFDEVMLRLLLSKWLSIEIQRLKDRNKMSCSKNAIVVKIGLAILTPAEIIVRLFFLSSSSSPVQVKSAKGWYTSSVRVFIKLLQTTVHRFQIKVG